MNRYIYQTETGINIMTVVDEANADTVVKRDAGVDSYIVMTDEEIANKPFIETSTIANGELFVDTYRTKEFLKGIAQGKKKQEVTEATTDGELQVIIAKYANIEVSINNASNEAELLGVFNGMN